MCLCECMLTTFSSYRRAFAQRPSANNNGNGRTQNQPPNRANTSSPTAYSPSSLVPPSIPAAPASPSLTQSMSANDQARYNNNNNNSTMTNKTPIFFREEHAGFIVKGNFMTLAAKPHLIEEGEWLAHQSKSASRDCIATTTDAFLVVEQNRLLSGMIKCVQSEDRSSGRSVCNEATCPTMSAGS